MKLGTNREIRLSARSSIAGCGCIATHALASKYKNGL